MGKETRETIKRRVGEFFESLEKEELLRTLDLKHELDNLEKLDVLRKENHEVLDEVLKRFKQGLLPLNRDKLNLFFIFYILDNFVFNVEFNLKILKAILDPAKIVGKFHPKTPYGSLIDRIAETLNLERSHKEDLKDLMFVDLRNSIAHLDYEIDHHSFSYNKADDRKITYTIERLPELMFDYQALNEGFLDFIHHLRKNKISN